MNERIELETPVVIEGTPTIYNGRTGVLKYIRGEGYLTHGVDLDGEAPHQARRWFSPGELKRASG
jgi:hypothetical protein